jgi:hypothetical protein
MRTYIHVPNGLQLLSASDQAAEHNKGFGLRGRTVPFKQNGLDSYVNYLQQQT